MARFWKQRTPNDRLEDELRALRPRPRAEFLEQTIAQLPAQAAPRHRFAPAIALTAILFAAITAAGGIGEAAAKSKDAVDAVSRAFGNDEGKSKGNGTGAGEERVVPQTIAAAGGGGGGGGGGSITICHATGSSSNPYVEITISTSGLSGHGGHSGDIVPAPSGGCPGGSPTDDQYKPGKGCGDKNHVHFREGQCKKEPS